MFTGIIEEKGLVKELKLSAQSARIWLTGKIIFEDLKLGDSVAVNGLCLTVAERKGDLWMADVMPETLKRSNLGSLKAGDYVNLERAMKADGRFGGHMVSGHIDGVGKITAIRKNENAVIFEISADQKLTDYMIEKGSISIDGISLTIIFVNVLSFGVSVIPHTLKETVLGDKKAGDLVNLENDLIGKYIKKFMSGLEVKSLPESRLTMDFLAKSGF